MGPDAIKAALAQLWDGAVGARCGLACPPQPSPLWRLLGFQGDDPVRDLRSGTFPLTLDLVAQGLRGSPALRREALLSALGAAPPFALCCLNVVHMLACHLKLLEAVPSFCPCCGAAVREAEYGRLAQQSHRGASLRGFVELLREAGHGRQEALDEDGGGILPPGELALGLLLQLAVHQLGEEWRRQDTGGRWDEGAAEEEEGVLLGRVKERAGALAGGGSRRSATGSSGGGGGTMDTRLLGFQDLLSRVRMRIMDALAEASRGAHSPLSPSGASNAGVLAGSAGTSHLLLSAGTGGTGEAIKRTVSDMPFPHGQTSAYRPPPLGGTEKTLSPLHRLHASASVSDGGRGSGGAAKEGTPGANWGGSARRRLEGALR